MAVAEDVCYSLHEFQAENPDELSFGALERIVILERDDQYGDGWFQGRNLAGEVGLFPQSYTSPELPTEADSPPPSPSLTSHSATSHTPEPVMAQHSNDVERALGQLTVGDNAHAKTDAASVNSGISKEERHSDDEGPSSGPVSNPRAVLALKAAAYAEREAQEEKDRAERRRAADEEVYALTRGESGIADGIQMSDESEDDDDDPPPQVNRYMSPSPVRAPLAVPVDEPSPELLLTPKAPGLSHSQSDVGSFVSDTSRDTAASVYDEGTPGSTGTSVPSERSPFLVPSPSVTPSASKDPLTPSKSNGKSFGLGSSLGSISAGAGAGGIAAVAYTGVQSFKTQAEPTARAPSPASARPSNGLHTPTSLSSSTTSNGLSGLAQPNGLEAHRGSATPTAISTALGGAFGQQSYSPSASLGSRSSSHLDTAPSTAAAASIGTGDTSPRDSAFGAAMSGGARSAGTESLPYDPRTWGVKEVCEWGKGKGFDDLTLSKFQEHEISGDVLLEMDVAMLKEIDLTAFGRRVHIYNAIKELRTRTSRPPSLMSHAGSMQQQQQPMSPQMSGYDADSPQTTGLASPRSMHFTSPAPSSNATSTFDPVFNIGGPRRDPDATSLAMSLPVSVSSLNGLGLDDQQASLQRSSSNGGIRAAALKSPPKTRASTGNAHVRSTTMDSFATSNDTVEDPIPEEEEVLAESAGSKAIRNLPATLIIPTKRPSTASGTTGMKSPSTSSLSRSDSTGASPREPRTKKSSDRSSFFSTTLGRSRKPPPRVPSSASNMSIDEGEGRLRPVVGNRKTLNASTSSKRTTRLFGFGVQTSAEKLEARKSSTGPAGEKGPSSMSPVGVEAAGPEMTKKQVAAVTTGNLLEKIGSPDYSGWMRKKGEKYSSWKQRFFVLKGVHLYYLKSESEQKIKGFINLAGYRVLADPDIHPGEFGFKIVHDTDRAHYFSAAEQVTVRNWMKEIMKATIGRDYSAAVVSSCNIETMPLALAQSMTPRPRPPSPSTRARVQKEKYNGAPNTLTPKDAMILMEFSSSPLMSSSATHRRESGSGSMNDPSSPVLSSVFHSLSVEPPINVPTTSKSSVKAASAPAPTPAPAPAPALDRSATPSRASPLLAWVNSALPRSTPPATDLGMSLRSGQILVRLLERLSGSDSGIDDAAFAAFKPSTKDAMFDASYFDTAFDVFDFISPLVSTEEISMDDMLSGNEQQLVLLVERIKAAFP